MYTRPAAAALTDCKLLVQPSAYVDGIIDQLPESHKKNEVSYGYTKKILCGGVAGVVSRTCTAPVDRLKVLLQVQSQQRVLGGSQTMTAWQIMLAMIREGPLTMWKGNAVNCMKIFPENAIRLTIFEYLNDTKLLTINRFWTLGDHKWALKFLNGAVTGMLVQTVMYPVELIKTRIMTFPSSSGSLGFWGATTRIWSEKSSSRLGLRFFNFYKGFTPAIVGVMPFAALELGCSKTGTERYKDHFKTTPGWMPLFAIGTTSSFIAMGATYPCRLVTCQMQAYTGPEKDRLKPLPHMKRLFKTEGIKGFYRGFWANSVKAIPASGIAWVTFNKAQELWDLWSERSYS